MMIVFIECNKGHNIIIQNQTTVNPIFQTGVSRLAKVTTILGVQQKQRQTPNWFE